MIKNVNNFSFKSFKNFIGPPPGSEFKQKNILFGYNGQGKSALSIGIMQEFLKDPDQTLENLRFFNKKYVEDNMLLDPDDKSVIRGVKVNFGARNVSIEKEIAELRGRLHDTRVLEDEISKLKIDTREEIDRIHTQRKGKSNIKKKVTGLDISEVVELYEKDIAEAKKIEPDGSILSGIVGDDSFEKQKSLVDSIIIGPIENILESDICQLEKLFSQTYKDIDIPSAQVIKWLNEGLAMHSEGDRCKFCGGALDYNAISSKVLSYNENLKQRAMVELSIVKGKIQKISDQLGDLIDRKENIIASLGMDNLAEEFKDLKEQQDFLYTQICLIEMKIDDMGISSLLNLERLKIFTTQLTAYVNIKNAKRKKLEEISERIINQSTLVKGAIGLAIKESSLISKNIEDIEQMETSFKTFMKENGEVHNKISQLQNQKSTTSAFAEHINSILESIGLNLRLSQLGDDYLMQHSEMDIQLSIEDISEGEQNLLSLLFFYYELFSDKNQKDFKKAIKLIIIDDPISSVDGINRMYVLEMIKEVLKLKDPQIFIFTHSWEDFCNLIYNKYDTKNTPFRFYEIRKNGSKSSLSTTKSNNTPYKHLFKEIYQFSEKENSSQLSDCEMYHYPNVMRKILEEFLEFKLGGCLPTASNKTRIEDALLKENNTRNRMKIGLLLDVCNILSHKASKCPLEIHQSAKFLMKCIQEVDKQHFNSMIA